MQARGQALGDAWWAPLGHPLVAAAVAAAAALNVAARLLARPGLWLDEALSVNIASLPLGDISEALRHDGHPPLFYVLLHGWMRVFGSGDVAARSLSSALSVVSLPLAYRLGRRVHGSAVGVLAVVVLALSPYHLRYGSEARMYALIICLVFAGALIVLNALDRAEDDVPWRWLVGVGVVTALLLWTHYWSMWLLGAVGVLMCLRIVRRRRSGWDRGALGVLGAMVAGGLAFLPWVPSMLYQAAHTGTPWAKVFGPTTLVVQSWQEFSGGPYSEPQVLALGTALVFAIGIFGVGTGSWAIELDLRTRPESRPLAATLLATVVVACIGGIATRTTFAPRYAAIYFPFVVVLVALGLSRFRGVGARSVVIAVFSVLSLVGSFVVLRLERTQAVDVARRISATGRTGALVAVCPDQLGPSTSRALGPGWDVVTYPRFESPQRVDWVDYVERNRANDPERFAEELLARADDRPIFVVSEDNYVTLVGQCASMMLAVSRQRPGARLVSAAQSPRFFETMSLYEVPPPGP